MIIIMDIGSYFYENSFSLFNLKNISGNNNNNNNNLFKSYQSLDFYSKKKLIIKKTYYLYCNNLCYCMSISKIKILSGKKNNY